MKADGFEMSNIGCRGCRVESYRDQYLKTSSVIINQYRHTSAYFVVFIGASLAMRVWVGTHSLTCNKGASLKLSFEKIPCRAVKTDCCLRKMTLVVSFIVCGDHLKNYLYRIMLVPSGMWDC